MIPKIFKNGIEIVKFERYGRYNYAYLNDGSVIPAGILGNIECECDTCGILKNINYRASILKKKYICKHCNSLGEKNGFYGKKHTDEFKKDRSEKMTGRYDGENNPFYGKKHTEKTLTHLKNVCDNSGEKNGFYGKKHTHEYKERARVREKERQSNLTESQRKERSKKLSESQKKLQKTDPYYYEKRRKAGKISSTNPEKYKINKIESIVYKKLQDAGIQVEYGVILGFNQYDFGNKDKRILIEVQGDYWHGNPKLYGYTAGLKPLNETQKRKIERDIEKFNFAIKNGMKIFYIWENDIINDKWDIITEILNEFNKI